MDTATPSSSANAAFTLDPETFKKIHPTEYQRRFISQGVRSDGRTLGKFRKAKISVGAITTANGSAMVRLGETTVICGIKAEVTEPKADVPRAGFVVPNFDFPPLCSPNFRPGPPSELAQTISEYLDQMLKSSGMLDLEQLCIEPGHAVWVLYADIICLNYDGNAMDAAIIALMAALKHVRLPKATYYAGESIVRVTDERTIPLKVQRTPMPTTFGVFDGQTILADPNSDEEPHLSSQLTVVIDGAEELCGVFKPGGTAMSRDVLLGCIETAKSRSADIFRTLEEALQI